jgi:hypothetical protein
MTRAQNGGSPLRAAPSNRGGISLPGRPGCLGTQYAVRQSSVCSPDEESPRYTQACGSAMGCGQGRCRSRDRQHALKETRSQPRRSEEAEQSCARIGPEVTKRPDFTHKRTNHELRRRCERYRARPLSGGIRHGFPWPVARRSRYSGTSKGAVCRAFGLKAYHPDRLPRLDRLVCRPQGYREA